jgi:hypothetical protein
METLSPKDALSDNMARRSFLRYAGIGVAAGTIAMTSACKKDKTANSSNVIDIGSGDVGILNYAYALEQLEAAFYVRVAASPYANITSAESALLTDIRDHEVAHREFFKAALGANAIMGLTVDFTAINFADRTSVLNTAKAFEDLGVAAYNGAGYLIKSADYLTLAGKIVSVEARHAAYIRNLIANGSYADSTVVDSNGLDKTMAIAQVLPTANQFLSTKVSANNYGYNI